MPDSAHMCKMCPTIDISLNLQTGLFARPSFPTEERLARPLRWHVARVLKTRLGISTKIDIRDENKQIFKPKYKELPLNFSHHRC